MGSHLPNANNQLQAVRPSDARRQFLSTLAPLTACVAGQRDDMSFYSLAAGDRNSTGSSRCSEYSIGDIDAILQNEDAKKVAPDVIAGTPGQEHNDELAAFAQQEATRTERIKKRYNTESSNATLVPTSNGGSDDDDEQNDYGFNHRPSVRGIKPRSNDEMLEEMQTQLSSASVTKPPPVKYFVQFTIPCMTIYSNESELMSENIVFFFHFSCFRVANQIRCQKQAHNRCRQSLWARCKFSNSLKIKHNHKSQALCINRISQLGTHIIKSKHNEIAYRQTRQPHTFSICRFRHVTVSIRKSQPFIKIAKVLQWNNTIMVKRWQLEVQPGDQNRRHRCETIIRPWFLYHITQMHMHISQPIK